MKTTIFLLSFVAFLAVVPLRNLYELPKSPLAPAEDIKNERREARASNLKTLFDKYKCPQLSYDLINDYILAAEQNNLDFRILPSISVQESSCGKRYPEATNNLWGWNSARSGFSSLREGVYRVAERLNSGRYYKNKSLINKLNAYNPNPEYAPKILRLMAEIKNQ